MRRQNGVQFEFNCPHCGEDNVCTYTNEEWEQNFWVEVGVCDDPQALPVIDVTCSNCGRSGSMSLY